MSLYRTSAKPFLASYALFSLRHAKLSPGFCAKKA